MKNLKLSDTTVEYLIKPKEKVNQDMQIEFGSQRIKLKYLIYQRTILLMYTCLHYPKSM